MNTFLRKAIGDIRAYPGRSVLFLVGVFVGTSLLIAALAGRAIVSREITASFLAAAPPHVIVALDAVTPAALEAARSVAGVRAAEPRRILRGRIETAQGWQALRVTVLPKEGGRSVSKVVGQSGFNPAGDAVWIERSSLPILGKGISERAAIRLPGGITRDVVVAGVASDGAVAPGWQDRIVYAYASQDALDRWAIPGGFDELHVLLDEGADVAAAATALRAALIAAAARIDRLETPVRLHPHDDQMRAVLMLISAFAIFGLLVSAALAASLVLASMTRELRLIGVMKAMGGSNMRIAVLYAGSFALIALASALAAIGPGWFAGQSFARFVGGELNLVGMDMRASPMLILAAVLVGIAVPSFSAIIVARRTLRLSVREALQGHRDPSVDRSAKSMIATNSPLNAAARRNLTRAPARLAVTLIALSLGGAALMTAGHAYRSLVAAVDRSLSFRADDVDIRLLRPAPAAALKQAIEGIEGVSAVEPWGGVLASLQRGDGTTSSRLGLLAPPADTKLLSLPIRQGRWIGVDALDEAVVTRNLTAKEPELVLGPDRHIGQPGPQRERDDRRRRRGGERAGAVCRAHRL
jgi:putative ABC transport system permease protein